jgi:hypothetical protein
MLTDAQISEILKGEAPPEAYKHATLIEYGKRFQLDLLIETGTHLGDGVEATKRHFSEVYSIEVGPTYFKNAEKRFENDTNVHILLGHSIDVLRRLLPTLTKKPLFYLDAHFRWDLTTPANLDCDHSPVKGELNTIFTLCPDSVIIIDDARLFNGGNVGCACSPALGELERLVAEKKPDWVFEIERDMMRLHPRQEGK